MAEQYINHVYIWLDAIPGFQDLQSSTAEISGTIKRNLSKFLQLLLTGGISFAGSTINIALQLFLDYFPCRACRCLCKNMLQTCRQNHGASARVYRQVHHRPATSCALHFLGIFFVAFVQGILTGIGFFIFGVNDAAFGDWQP